MATNITTFNNTFNNTSSNASTVKNVIANDSVKFINTVLHEDEQYVDDFDRNIDRNQIYQLHFGDKEIDTSGIITLDAVHMLQFMLNRSYGQQDFFKAQLFTTAGSPILKITAFVNSDKINNPPLDYEKIKVIFDIINQWATMMRDYIYYMLAYNEPDQALIINAIICNNDKNSSIIFTDTLRFTQK